MGKSKLGRIGSIALSLMMLFGDQFLEAREIRARILQEKLGRLYFSVGKDEDVWPGCKWRVYRDSTDTIKPACEGKIAEAYEGVSIGDSIDLAPVNSDKFVAAMIDAADTSFETIVGVAFVDNISESVVTGDTLTDRFVRNQQASYSTDERNSVYGMQGGPGLRNRHEELIPLGSYYGIAIYPYSFYLRCNNLPPFPYSDTHLEMAYWDAPCIVGMTCTGNDAPFFVALVPNISRPINRNALLTTALRYKIDTSQISGAFEFESVPQLSFLPGKHTYTAYGFDLEKAKKLLRENKSAGSAVSIDTYSPTLQSTSKFIRGTLAQAGYATTTVGWNQPSDLRLAILPIYSDSPWVALREVLSSVAKDTVEKDRANQPLRLADRLLDDAVHTSDTLQRGRLLERVDRILMEDIGAFPLFRPVIHVCAKEEIRGIRFDKDGRLDLRSIYRLKLPTDTTGGRR